MKKLFVYLKDYKKESIIAPLFKLLEALFDLFVPVVVASIINKGIGGGDKDYVIKGCLLLLALAVIGLTCSLIAQFFAARAAVGFSSKLRSALFAKIQSFSFDTLDKIGISTLETRLTNDVNVLQNGVNMALRLLLRSPFIVFGALIMAFTINVKAALIFVVVIIVLFIIVFGIILSTMPLHKKVQENVDRVLKKTRENLTGVRVIRAFGGEEKELLDFDNENKGLYKSQIFVGRISALMNPMTFAVINIAVVAILYYGGLGNFGEGLGSGDFVALIDYMSQILVELVKLANTIVLLTRAMASAKRVTAVFDTASDFREHNVKVTEDEKAPAIEFSGVSFDYNTSDDAEAYALNDLSFVVEKGETLGIIGGTGSGKSTLAGLICGFYSPTKGLAKLSGVNIDDYDEASLHKKVGIVMQKALLFKGTIRDNLLWGDKNASDEELWEALRIAQAKDVVEKKEKGLDSLVEQGGRNFSGGQKQRISIARTLVAKPEIIILDDSASALDFATDAALRKAISEMGENNKKLTTVIISQRASSVMNADKIIVLDEGIAVGIGTHEELLKNCEVYGEIYRSQFE